MSTFFRNTFLNTRVFYARYGIRLAESSHYDMGMRFIQRSLEINRDWQKLRHGGYPETLYLISHPSIHRWQSAIGHLCVNIDILIKMMKLGWIPESKIVMLVDSDETDNFHILEYWKKYIEIVSNKSEIERLMPSALESEFWQSAISYWQFPWRGPAWVGSAVTIVEEEWEKQKRPPLLSLTEEDLQRGREALRRLGVPDGAWFVCFHARDSIYRGEGASPELNWRNANIDTFAPAATIISECGGYVINMGHEKSKPFSPCGAVIDYAHSSEKSDWMDIFLCSQCRFFVGTNSGLVTLPFCFGVPVVLVHTFPAYVRGYSSRDIFILKTYRNKLDAGRLIDFKEVIMEKNYFQNFHAMKKDHIVPDENSAEDICEAVREMIGRLEASMTYSVEDEDLQARFNSLMPDYGMGTISRAGTAFLRKYRELLP